MLRRLCTLLLALACALAPALASPSPSTQVASFSKLPWGDRLEVRYVVVGCFSFNGAVFEFSPAGDGEFEVFDLKPMPRTGDSETKWIKHRLGSVRLGPGETQKLDTLLALYRNPETPKILTLSSSVDVEVTQFRGSRIVAKEQFGWGEKIPDTGRTPVLHFSEMLAAIKRTTAPSR